MKHVAMIALLGLASSAAFAEGAVPMPDKATACFACHGEGGRSTNGMYPVLAGQYANYLEHALGQYKAGERKNPIMGAQAAALNKDEIHALALYFGSQNSPLYTPSVHGDLKQ